MEPAALSPTTKRTGVRRSRRLSPPPPRTPPRVHSGNPRHTSPGQIQNESNMVNNKRCDHWVPVYKRSHRVETPEKQVDILDPELFI